MRKSFLISFLIIIATSIAKANTYDWSDLESGKKYLTSLDFRLSPDVAWQTGDSFYLKEVYGLGSIPVIVFDFEALVCASPDQKTDVEFITPPQVPGDSRDRRVWAELDYNCIIHVYVEAQDYYSPSFFRN